MGDPQEPVGPLKYCQAHETLIPAEAWYRGRYRCADCMQHIKDANGRTRLHKEAPSKAFVQGQTLQKLVEPSAPPAFREYKPPQSMLDAYAKAHAYHALPSLVRDD